MDDTKRMWEALWSHEPVEFELRLYDRAIGRFVLTRDRFGETSIREVPGSVVPRELLPLGYDPEDVQGSMRAWLSRRVIPRNQAFAREVLEAAGIPGTDRLSVVRETMGLTLADAYWFVPKGTQARWSDVNLFDNGVESVLGIVAYCGHTSSEARAAGAASTWTLQSSGQFPKAWRRVGGELRLYKAGSYSMGDRRVSNDGREPYSEVAASQVAEAMGVSHVPYWLEAWHGDVASVCPIMNDSSTGLVSAWSAVGSASVFDVAYAYARMGEAFYDALTDMIVLDAVTLNVDRHANNYALLRDNATGRILAPAPVFDNNLSFLPRWEPDEMADPLNPPAGVPAPHPAGQEQTFDELCSFVMEPRHHEALRRLLDFEVQDDPRCPIPEGRRAAMGRLVRLRARKLLEIGTITPEDRRSLTSRPTRDPENMPVFASHTDPVAWNRGHGSLASSEVRAAGQAVDASQGHDADGTARRHH